MFLALFGLISRKNTLSLNNDNNILKGTHQVLFSAIMENWFHLFNRTIGFNKKTKRKQFLSLDIVRLFTFHVICFYFFFFQVTDATDKPVDDGTKNSEVDRPDSDDDPLPSSSEKQNSPPSIDQEQMSDQQDQQQISDQQDQQQTSDQQDQEQISDHHDQQQISEEQDDRKLF